MNTIHYKVLTIKDKWFSGRFDAAGLEEELNKLAAGGWRVVASMTASRAGLVTGGGKDEMIIILEHDSTPSRPKKELEAMLGSGPVSGKSAGPTANRADDGVYRLD
jgi:hypothetical protein